MRYSVTVGMAVTRNCGGCLQDGEKSGGERRGWRRESIKGRSTRLSGNEPRLTDATQRGGSYSMDDKSRQNPV